MTLQIICLNTIITFCHLSKFLFIYPWVLQHHPFLLRVQQMTFRCNFNFNRVCLCIGAPHSGGVLELWMDNGLICSTTNTLIETDLGRFGPWSFQPSSPLHFWSRFGPNPNLIFLMHLYLLGPSGGVAGPRKRVET